MKSVFEILAGLILIIIFSWAITFGGWWQAIKDILQGGILLSLLGLGLVLVFLGISELKG